MKVINSEYKKRNMKIWNEVAPRYHKRWASVNKGPFQSTKKLIELIKINKNNLILDVACGTGVVTKQIQKKIGKSGYVIGIDTSTTAIKIAKKENEKNKNLDFLNADAENFSFSKKFDIVTCQYALFFFPNEQKVLKNMKKFLKKNGTITLAVHGKYNVPYFDCILESVKKFIPNYLPKYPEMDRFGTKETFAGAIKKAGFSKIIVKKFVFKYSPGTFSEYWNNYKKHLSKPLKEKFDSLTKFQKANLREMVKDKTIQYTKNDGKIVFPWEVLVLTAKNE